jgi:hypothetical protein
MDSFAYLSVLISIILGLGVANLLTGLARIVQLRARVRFYWPTIAWALTLLVIHVQTWWTMFGLRQVRHWDFVSFSVTLMQPILLFFLSALILGDFDRDDALDLKRNYYTHARWFFAIFIALLFASIARTTLLAHQLPGIVDLAFHGLFLALAACAAIVSNERYHKLAALLAAAIMGVYIALLFMELR